MPQDLSRFLRLDDARRTVVELRDLLSSELRASVAADVLAFEEVEAERCRHVVTLGMRDGRPFVLFDDGEDRCVVRAATEGDPPESRFGEDVRYATPIETLSHALWLLQQDHAASFPARFNWDRAEGIVISVGTFGALARSARQTLADLGDARWQSRLSTIVWRTAHEGFVPARSSATLVTVGGSGAPRWMEARVRIVELAQDVEVFHAGNVPFLLESDPDLDPRSLDLRFLEPHVHTVNLVMVLCSEEGFLSEIARTVTRRFSDGERLVILLAPGATPTDGVDLAVCETYGEHLVIDALAAVFDGGVLGFDAEDLRTLGRHSAVTGVARCEGRAECFRYLLDAAINELAWSPARRRRATAYLFVVFAPFGTRLAELEALVAPVQDLVGSDPTVLIQYVHRERQTVQLTVLAFEPAPAERGLT